MHGLNPLRILESSGDIVRLRDRWKYGGEAISWVEFNDDTFRSSLHVRGGGGGWGGMMGKGLGVWLGEEGEGVGPNKPTEGDG